METLKLAEYRHEGYDYKVRLTYSTEGADIYYFVELYDSVRWYKMHTLKRLDHARLYFDAQCVVLERELESMGWHRPKRK